MLIDRLPRILRPHSDTAERFEDLTTPEIMNSPTLGACQQMGRVAQYHSDQSDAYAYLARSEELKDMESRRLAKYLGLVPIVGPLYVLSGCGVNPAVEAAKAQSTEHKEQSVIYNDMYAKCVSSIETGNIEEQDLFLLAAKQLTDPGSFMDDYLMYNPIPQPSISGL